MQFQKNAVYGIVKYITVIVRNGIAVGITKNEKEKKVGIYRN